MISNRQGGRRRGRGGQRNVGGQPGGNRQDNRQRGNAAQLLEKYKSMARDAQLSGDRVQMEYYLQFADHYFRLLSESRARFEDQRRQRGDDGDDGDDEDDVETSSDQDDDDGDQDSNRQRPRAKNERQRRPAREQRVAGNGSSEGRDSDDERIAVDVLPPSIGRDSDSDDSDEPKAPKRRPVRRTRSNDGDNDIAPAA